MRRRQIGQIRRFYEANRRALFTYALSLTRDVHDAEDAVHKAIAGLLGLRELPRELRPYVFRSIRNAALDLGRTQRTSGEVSDSIFVENGVVEPTYPRLMDDALSNLSIDERDAIVLKLYGELTFQEIAESRGVSVNTAASWYRRGLDKLREILKELPYE